MINNIALVLVAMAVVKAEDASSVLNDNEDIPQFCNSSITHEDYYYCC